MQRAHKLSACTPAVQLRASLNEISSMSMAGWGIRSGTSTAVHFNSSILLLVSGCLRWWERCLVGER